jgi:DNA-binding response OmpR family regulator
MLVEQGYSVIAVGRGDEALCRCLEEQGEIDLLLTDLILPDMTGMELARGMANIYAGLKVLYMSGYAERAVTERGLLELGDQFLSKPFSLNRLVRQVRETLDRVPELAA